MSPRLALLTLVLVGCGTAKASPPQQQRQPSATAPRGDDALVAVDIYGLHSDRGTVQVGLYRTADGFPKDPDRSFAQRTVRVTGKNQRIVFERVPAGPFAVAVHHDEDGDGKMDTGMFGIPSEGYAFSRDAKVSMGPPSFASARVTVQPGQTVRVPVHMRY